MSNAPIPRKHVTRGNGSTLTIDPRLARLVLEMCLRKQAQRSRPAPRNYVPRMDLYDDENQTHITAMLELPGVPRENMSVVVREGKLIVTGERNSPLASRLVHDSVRSRRPETNEGMAQDDVNPTKYRFRELKFGRFCREVDIPAGTQASDVSAEMSDGMLLLSWPRTPGSPASLSRAGAPAS